MRATLLRSLCQLAVQIPPHCVVALEFLLREILSFMEHWTAIMRMQNRQYRGGASMAPPSVQPIIIMQSVSLFSSLENPRTDSSPHPSLSLRLRFVSLPSFPLWCTPIPSTGAS